MRVLLASYGTRGDVEPIVALAVQLRALGAEVRVCAPPDDAFGALLDRAGVPAAPFARSWRSWATESSTARERVASVDEYVGAHVAATYETLEWAAHGCDVLVASGMLHFVATTAAERVGIPHRFALFSPSLLGPKPWHARVKAPIDAHRASLGLPPVEDLERFFFTERPWVAADPVLAPPREDDGHAGAALRFPAWVLPDERPLPGDLAAFLDAGPPPVHVGFGSMLVPRESARAVVEAARAQGRRAVVARGWADLDLRDEGDDCLVVGEVNQQALFRRVAAVVHHGGAGTTATAARAGAPQAIVPQVADQPHWAARVAELGIGAAHDGPEPTVDSLSAALATALAPETAARAAGVAAAMPADGAATAARRLLEGFG